MDANVVFRIIFAFYIVAFYILRMTRKHQPFSRKKQQKQVRKQVGIREVLFIILYPFWLAVMILYPSNFSWINVFALSFPDWLRWCGVVMAAISLLLLWWVHHALGKYFSHQLKLLDTHKLVTHGPYQWVRHPMYTTEFIIFISACLISANLLVVVPNILAIILIYLRINKEEEMMLERFGKEYRSYMKQTGKLLPRFTHQSYHKKIND